MAVDGFLGAQEVLAPSTQQRVDARHTGRKLAIHQWTQTAAYFKQVIGANMLVLSFLRIQNQNLTYSYR